MVSMRGSSAVEAVQSPRHMAGYKGYVDTMRRLGRFSAVLLILFFAFQPSTAGGATDDIALDSVSSQTFDAVTNDQISWNHTVGSGGTNRILVVGVSFRRSNSVTVTGITYGSSSLIYILAADSTDQNTKYRAELYYLIAPTVGTAAITVSFSGTDDVEHAVGSGLSFTGVHQTTAIGTPNGAGGTKTTAPSVTVSSATREVVVDTVAAKYKKILSLTVGAGQTERWNRTITAGSFGLIGAGSTEPGASSVTMSWTPIDFEQWAMVAVPLKPATSPTAVRLQSLRALRYNDQILIRWRTGYEVDNLGFHVYRDRGGMRTQLTQELLAGSALVARMRTVLGAGHSYAWRDSFPERYGPIDYWLQSVDLDGRRTWHGPIVPEPSAEPLPEMARANALSRLGDDQTEGGDRAKIRSLRHRLRTEPPADLLLPAMDAVDSNPLLSIQPDRPRALRDASAGRLRHLSRRKRVRALKKQRELAAGPSLKLAVRENGWHRVGQPELVSAGLDPEVHPRHLQLFADGTQVPMTVTGERDGRFDPQDGIEFYGAGLDEPSTDTRIYWLVEGQEPGKRVGQKGGISRQSYSGMSSFPFTTTRKQHLIYAAAIKNGDAENFFGNLVAASPVDQLLVAPNVDPAPPGGALLEVALQGLTEAPHQVAVFLNGGEVSEVVFDGQDRGVTRTELSQASLLDGDNLVTLLARGGAMDLSLVDSIRLTYWHTYTADEDSLRCKARGGELLSIGGFSSADIRVMDITNPLRVFEIRGKVENKDSGYAFTFTVPGRRERTLLAFTTNRVQEPVEIRPNHPSAWHRRDHEADLVILSHSDFLESLIPLVNLRESQGLQVAIIDVEDLYDEFGFGAKSSQALRTFLKRAWHRWRKPPRFVLLVGDASFDPRNHLFLGNYDFVPTRLVDTKYMETASDGWFADFDGDDRPDIPVGRLPVRTSAETTLIVAKLLDYEATPHSGGAILVADSNDEEYDFEAASRNLHGLLPQNMTVQEIFKGQMGTQAARAELLFQIAQGPLLVNYMGHGSVESWRSGLFHSGDASGLDNGSYMPMFVAMTCLNGLFHDLYTESLAESLLKAEAGSIAIFASSGLTGPEEQAVMNQELLRLLFGQEPLTIGEACMRAKKVVDDPDILRTWILFGDPTLRLR